MHLNRFLRSFLSTEKNNEPQVLKSMKHDKRPQHRKAMRLRYTYSLRGEVSSPTSFLERHHEFRCWEQMHHIPRTLLRKAGLITNLCLCHTTQLSIHASLTRGWRPPQACLQVLLFLPDTASDPRLPESQSLSPFIKSTPIGANV